MPVWEPREAEHKVIFVSMELPKFCSFGLAALEQMGAPTKKPLCLLLALLGPREMSDLSPQSGPRRTLDQVRCHRSRFY